METDKVLDHLKDLCEWGVGLYLLRSANIDAYAQGQQHRLEDLRGEVQALKSALKENYGNIESLKVEITSQQSQKLDVAELLKKQQLLEQEISQKEEELKLARERETSLTELLKKSNPKKDDLLSVNVYLKEAVYPILEGLKENKALGFRSALSEKMLQIDSFSTTGSVKAKK